MGQSNSTSPLLITQSNQPFRQFNYSRLITAQQQNKVSLKSSNSQTIFKKTPKQYFKLNSFESLNGDDLLVRDRENKIDQIHSQQSGSTLKNISNLKMVKHSSSMNSSKQKLTSIAHLQLPQQTTFAQSQRNSKPSHIKFYSTHRMVCKNYIIQKIFSEDKKKFTVKITNYFIEEEEMENYVSNLIKLKQVLMDIQLYQDFSIMEEQGLYIIQRQYSGQIDFAKGKLSKKLLKDNVPLLLDYLCFLAKIYRKIDDIYIDPQDVYFDNHQFYLVDFKYKQVHPFEIILATLEWIFKTNQPDANKLIQQKLLRVSGNSNKPEKTLQQCFIRKDQLENASSFPLYVRELWKNLVEKKIQRDQLLPYITRLKCKAITLSMKIDSFHACLNHKKTWIFQEEKHSWILGKKSNQVYFYNINDDHKCQVKVVRKKNKIDLSQIKIVFDPQELQIKYIAQNSKLIIHISEFELQKSSCLSDIEIKHRLPLKFKNPFIFYEHKHQQMFILQNCVYKYSITENKMSQQTKKISQCIFLARSHDCAFMVVKMSIDIFKNGIRVFINQAEMDLFFVGQESLLQQVSNIRVDIRTVDFCKQIYKGVYIMLANRNMWILDLNFNVFYSFATTQRVKKFYGFASVANSSNHSKGLYHQHKTHSKPIESNNHTDYAFQIFNQPFKAQFLTYQEGLNAKIKDDQLHIIGEIQGNMYYLNYAFMPQAGSLKLLSYKPLFGVESKTHSNEDINNDTKKNCDSEKSLQNNKKDKTKRVKIAEQNNECDEQKTNLQVQNNKQPSLSPNVKALNHRSSRNSRQINELSILKFLKSTTLDTSVFQFYHFNFHEQNLPSYKNDSWLFFNDHLFIKPEDFYLKTNKTNYEIQLKIKKIKCSLKDLIEKFKKANQTKSMKERKSFTKQECLLYMLRCIEIYEWLAKNQLYHRNLSINNLYFMQSDNSLKLIGWSEPPRNWYVSDFKDLLLVFFNIITCNSLQKLNQKMLYKYKTQLQQFSVIYDKMQIAFKYMKVSQKKAQIQKEIKEIRDSLLKELTDKFLFGEQDQKSLKTIGTTSQNDLNDKNKKQTSINSNEFIFNFQYNTPRFSMVSISKKKMKKMKCLLDQNSKEQLIFKSTDKYLWNQEKSQLYMFTTSYHFYELKINTQSFKQETLVCEEYEYLPNNILESTFLYAPNHGIMSIGGIYKAKDTKLTFNRTVYQFNSQKLTWDTLCQIPQPRVNPYVILSRQGKQLYIMGGQTDHSSQNMHILKMNLSKENIEQKQACVELLIDPYPFNPFSQVLSSYPSKVYNISKELELFVLFAITPDKYLIRLFSLNSFCLDLHLDAKNYSDDNKIISSSVGVTFSKGTMHVLRQYGKYAKVSLNKLQTLTVINETVYPEREDKVQG